MKKKLYSLFIFVLAIFALFAPSKQETVEAKDTSRSDGIPYETLTLGTDNRLVPTQTAYIPYGILNDEVQFSNPQDLYIYEDAMYVADTGNKRIVSLDLNGNLLFEIAIEDYYQATYDGSQIISEVKVKEFNSPTGVFVRTDEVEVSPGVFESRDYIYVADASITIEHYGYEKTDEDNNGQLDYKLLQTNVGAVIKFSYDGVNAPTIERFYERPVEPLFGKNTKYQPTKIAVANSGYMYIIGEGSTNGLITMNDQGQFMGFVGINTATFSLRKFFYNLFVADSSLAGTRPDAPTNVAIGNNGNIYTTNINITETFKRLNISGQNTLDANTYYPSTEDEIADIAISGDNYTYICTKSGMIYEYDIKGNLLFAFNTANSGGVDVFGLNTKLSSIEIGDNGSIYALDPDKGRIQMYQRAGFVDVLHEAVDLYNDGRYLESKPLWENILKQNTNFALAHTALGFALFKEGNYSAALEEFHQSKNFNGYSQVFWEIRNTYIQAYTGTALLILIAVYVLYKVLKFILMRNAKEYKGKLVPEFVYNRKVRYDEKEKSKFELKFIKLKEELAYSMNIFKHPADMCYGIKKENKASYLSAIIVLIAFVAVVICDSYATGFLFRNHGGMGNAFTQILAILAVFMLWCGTNYLVSTLNDGEGWFKDFFIGTCYCLIPFIIFKIPMILLTHVLTYNEQFILQFADVVIYAYTVILVLIMIQYIHQYTLKETLKNIVITIFGMIIFALMILLVYMFASQLVDFVVSLIKEVIFRV